jgi:serine/threonine-protein kinase
VDLKKVLRQGGGLSPQRAYAIAIQVAEGLQAVHEAGIVHRDLKTSNIMIDPDGVARLLDFGVAKRLGDGTLTAAGHIVGTPEYMSPEQAQGKKVDFRSDVYALGVVLFEIFTGRVPFHGETPISTILKHINEPPPLQGSEAAGIPERVKPILRRMLAKDPALRYQSAREVAEALRKVAERGADDRLPVTQVVAIPRSAPVGHGEERKTRAFPLWILGGLLVALAGVGIVVLKEHGDQRSSATASLTALPTEPSAPASLHVAPTLPAAPSPAPPPPQAVAMPNPTPKAPPRAAQPAPESPRGATIIAASPSLTAAPATNPSAAPSAISASSEPGMLQVVVRPWGTVAIDGKPMGETPLEKLRLAPGPHVIRVRHPAYEPWERTVVVRSGETDRILVDFPSDGVRKP